MKTEPRTGTQEHKALEAFRRATFSMLTSAMLVNAGAGYRYGGVLDKLRKRGHVIETYTPAQGPTPNQKNTFWYELVHDATCMCELEGPLFCEVHVGGYIDHEYEKEVDRRIHNGRK